MKDQTPVSWEMQRSTPQMLQRGKDGAEVSGVRGRPAFRPTIGGGGKLSASSAS